MHITGLLKPLQGSAHDTLTRFPRCLSCGKARPAISFAPANCRQVQHVVIMATVDAADVAEALDLTWWTFRKAAGEDLAGWALAAAEAEVRPEAR